MAAVRLALPAAYADPAFRKCLMTAIAQPGLVEQFDRLYYVSLFDRRALMADLISTGKADTEMVRFAQFVHGYMYRPMSDKDVIACRAAATDSPDSSNPKA